MRQIKLIVIILFCINAIRAPGNQPPVKQEDLEEDEDENGHKPAKWDGYGKGRGFGFERKHNIHGAEENFHYGKPCQVMLPCQNNTKLAYGSMGKNCFIFQNLCKLRNENCRRHNVFMQTLELVPYNDCKLLCKKRCGDVVGWLCAGIGEKTFSFLNECEWNAAMCIDNTYYEVLYPGRCVD